MFVVVAPMTNPIMATDFEAVMCQVLSLSLPEIQETRMVLAPAIKYYIRSAMIYEVRCRGLTGGQVRTRVMV